MNLSIKYTNRFAAALASVALLAGCTDLLTGGELLRMGEPTGIIEVVNGSSAPF